MIRGKNLTKKFGDKTALDSVNFEIEDGSIYGLIGSNGSGKSTLMRLISGVYMPDSGEITIDSCPVFDNPILKYQVAFLGDTPYFLSHSNLDDMSKFYESMYPSFDRSVYNHLTEIFPLDRKKNISAMSKGMQRQAALILSMSLCPRYLLLDEAFDGLDAVMRKVLKLMLVDGIEKRGMTAIIASHNLRELEDLCDHVGLIHDGHILFNNDVETLRGNLHKLQAAFAKIPEQTVFNGLDILHFERSGSILQMVVRGDEQEILSYVNKLGPVFAECIEPSLEEMFLYELEVKGYDVKNILK